MSLENEIMLLSLFDWEQYKKTVADLQERVARLESPRIVLPPVDLHTLLSADPDLTVYEIQSGDRETPASISIADWKEALLAINVCSRRIHSLVKDLERAEARIDSLERGSNC